jgi:hypothetical protein
MTFFRALGEGASEILALLGTWREVPVNPDYEREVEINASARFVLPRTAAMREQLGLPESRDENPG